jgi:Cu/Ag efflux pump CusA
MWIVKLALRLPDTFIVLALLILLLSPLTILPTPTEIFPNITIPVISVAWTYTDLNPEDVEARQTTPYEKVSTTLVDKKVSLGREVSIVFTSNGPLLHRWGANREFYVDSKASS